MKSRLILRLGKSKLHRFTRSASGSFTLEASLTLPMILIATLLLLFMALFVYHQSSSYHQAGLSADRTAYIWDNSRKNLITGAVSADENDGLYWRLTSDNWSNLFQFLLPIDSAHVSLPLTEDMSGDANSPEGKLAKTAGTLSSGWSGELRYENLGLLRNVSVDLNKMFRSPFFAKNMWGDQKVKANAKSYVVDPVETIRLTDLTRTFIGEVQGRIKPKDALKVMTEPKAIPKEPVPITSHEQAANYLQMLVSGTSKVINVDSDTQRVVDALDAGGVAHQAYYTFNEKDLRETQMPKDVELLKQGTQIKGVVWHFFKLSKQDKVKLSQGLKQELERKGIVVIFHE